MAEKTTDLFRAKRGVAVLAACLGDNWEMAEACRLASQAAAIAVRWLSQMPVS